MNDKAQRPVVLAVDDTPENLDVVKGILSADYRIKAATNGEAALRIVAKQLPDIILLDIEMPRMDGYQFAAHVRNDARFKDVPIIMITSRSGEKHRAKAIEVGVNDYLSKPYQEQHLVDAIESQLGRRV